MSIHEMVAVGPRSVVLQRNPKYYEAKKQFPCLEGRIYYKSNLLVNLICHCVNCEYVDELYSQVISVSL